MSKVNQQQKQCQPQLLPYNQNQQQHQHQHQPQVDSFNSPFYFFNIFNSTIWLKKIEIIVNIYDLLNIFEDKNCIINIQNHQNQITFYHIYAFQFSLW